MLSEMDCELELSGTGETQEAAFHQIFSGIKPLLGKKFPDFILIQIEPKGVNVISAMATSRTERFFGILFPRKTINYNFEVTINVHLRYIELSKITVVHNKEKISLIQRVLK